MDYTIEYAAGPHLMKRTIKDVTEISETASFIIFEHKNGKTSRLNIGIVLGIFPVDLIRLVEPMLSNQPQSH